MFYLFVELSDQFPVLNVFRYITFRTGGAIMTALLVVFLFGPGLINLLRLRQGAASRSGLTDRRATS